jgi:hypothetical protein
LSKDNGTPVLGIMVYSIFILLGLSMKRLFGERRHASGVHPDGPIFKERRKAYYHGKYSKRLLLLLFIIFSFTLILIKVINR